MTETSDNIRLRKTVCVEMVHTDNPMRPVTAGIAPTLQARMGTGGNQVPLVYVRKVRER